MILLLHLLFSFCFDWEYISNTQDSVSSAIQTPQISSKILHCESYFQLSSRCLDIPMNLIYYTKIADLANFHKPQLVKSRSDPDICLEPEKVPL